MVSEYDLENPSRPRGMFSPTDREWLLDMSDIDEKSQAERNRRARIRERLTQSLLDFTLVSEMEPRDRRRIFTRQEANEHESERLSALHQSLISLFAFLYRELETTPDSSMTFEECLRTGVLRSYFRSESSRMVTPGDVQFEVDEPEQIDVEAVAKRLADDGPETLTESELRFVLRVITDEQELTSEELGQQLLVLSESDSASEKDFTI